MTRKELGKRIATLRFQKFGNCRESAEKLGMTSAMLRRIESGTLKRVDVFMIVRLNHIFGVDLLAEIQEGEHNETTPHHTRGDVNSNCRND